MEGRSNGEGERGGLNEYHPLDFCVREGEMERGREWGLNEYHPLGVCVREGEMERVREWERGEI